MKISFAVRWTSAAQFLRCGSILVCLSVSSGFPAPGLDGVWQSDGYGYILVIQGTHIESLQVTTTTCVKGPAARFIDARGRATNSEGEGFIIRNEDSADNNLVHPDDIHFDRISALPPVCNHLTPNNPASNFEVFSRTFAENYVRLGFRQADWDALTERARSAVTPATSPTQLFEIMKSLIEPFGDAHTGIYAPSIHREFEGFRPGGYQVTEGKAEEDFRNHRMRVIWGVTDALLAEKPRNFVNGEIAYGRAGKGIGYLRILAMGGVNFKNDLRVLESTLDKILSDPDLRALILDLRINFGGGDAFGFAIASRFAASDYLAFTQQARNSPADRARFTPEEPVMLHAGNRPSFHGPIVELIGPLTISAGESFTMALMGHAPRVVRIGENTQGVFFSVRPRRLPNGWTIYLPNGIIRTKEGKAFDAVGVPPDIPVAVFADQDLAAGRDPALSAAISLLELHASH